MKKAISLILSLCFLCSLCVTAFAADVPSEPIDGSSMTVGRSVADDPSYTGTGLLEATQEEMDYWAQYAPDEILEEEPITRAATWTTLEPFTYYKQEVNNTCTIACVRMALKYVHGSTPSESTIKSTTGAPCSIADAVDYFNNYTSDYSYSVKYGGWKSTMKSNLYSCISDGAPPILGIHMTTSDGWPYDLDCHAVAAYAALSNKSKFALCDPWAGYKGDDDWRWYSKTADDLYDAFSGTNAGYMY